MRPCKPKRRGFSMNYHFCHALTIASCVASSAWAGLTPSATSRTTVLLNRSRKNRRSRRRSTTGGYGHTQLLSPGSRQANCSWLTTGRRAPPALVGTGEPGRTVAQETARPGLSAPTARRIAGARDSRRGPASACRFTPWCPRTRSHVQSPPQVSWRPGHLCAPAAQTRAFFATHLRRRREKNGRGYAADRSAHGGTP